MARKSTPRTGRVRVTRSFDLLVIGEEFDTELTGRALDLVSGGYLELIEHGESATGPGPAHESDQGGGPEDSSSESPAGAEQGQDFGSGGYGASA